MGALDCSAAPYLAKLESGSAPNPSHTAPETTAARGLLSVGIEPELLRLAVQARLRAIPTSRRKPANPGLSMAARRVLRFAETEVRALKLQRAGTEHLVTAVLRTRWHFMPWYVLFYIRAVATLVGLVLKPDETRLRLWKASGHRGVYLADVLHEFHLDLTVARHAATNMDPERATLPWADEVKRATQHAQAEARETGAGRVGAEHLWLGLLAEPTSAGGRLLEEAGIVAAPLQKHLRAALRSDDETAGTKILYTKEAKSIFRGAEWRTRSARNLEVGSDNLLLALVAAGGRSRAQLAIAAAMVESGFAPDHLVRALPATVRGRTLTLPEIEQRIRTIVAKEYCVAVEAVTSQTNLKKAAPSNLEMLYFFLECNREFGIAVGTGDFRKHPAVADIALLVQERMEKRRAAEAAKLKLLWNSQAGWLTKVLYSLPFAISLVALLTSGNGLMLLLFGVSVLMVLTSPLTNFGPVLPPSQQKSYYALGILAIVFLYLLIDAVTVARQAIPDW